MDYPEYLNRHVGLLLQQEHIQLMKVVETHAQIEEIHLEMRRCNQK